METYLFGLEGSDRTSELGSEVIFLVGFLHPDSHSMY